MDADKGGGSGDGSGEKTFTQEEVNSLLAKNKKALKEKNEELAKELETLQEQQKLTGQAKADLEKRIKELREEHMSESEKLEAQRKALKDESENIAKERDLWKRRFIDSAVKTTITNEAAKLNAFNPAHIVALTAGDAKVEVQDDGSFNVKFGEKDLSVEDYLKTFKEDENNKHLFNNKKKTGTGNTQGGKPVSLEEINSFEDFIKNDGGK